MRICYSKKKNPDDFTFEEFKKFVKKISNLTVKEYISIIKIYNKFGYEVSLENYNEKVVLKIKRNFRTRFREMYNIVFNPCVKFPKELKYYLIYRGK